MKWRWRQRPFIICSSDHSELDPDFRPRLLINTDESRPNTVINLCNVSHVSLRWEGGEQAGVGEQVHANCHPDTTGGQYPARPAPVQRRAHQVRALQFPNTTPTHTPSACVTSLLIHLFSFLTNPKEILSSLSAAIRARQTRTSRRSWSHPMLKMLSSSRSSWGRPGDQRSETNSAVGTDRKVPSSSLWAKT